MISIIVAIYNQLHMNRIFHEKLKRYTHHPFELIIIDNLSNDGSREYFRNAGAKVIENDANYSYPYCQNLGIKNAKYDFFAFLNNDVIVAPQWDKKLLNIMKEKELDIITPCGFERLENRKIARRYKKKWQAIKIIIGFLGYGHFQLELMHKLMYKDWEDFCQKRFEKYGFGVMEGFVGNSVIMTRMAIEKIGLYDERIQGADFDLYIRSKKRSLEIGDIKPVHIALGVFHHHYIRLTAESVYPPLKDKDNLIPLEEKWGEATVRKFIDNLYV